MLICSHNLRNRHQPRRQVIRGGGPGEAPAEDEDEEREHGDVGDERGETDPGQEHDLALGLEELLGGEVDGDGEELGDDADGEFAGLDGDGFFLAEEAEDRGGEDVDGAHEGRGGDEDDPRTLQVHAEHRHLPGAEGLPAQRLQRAPHAQLPAMSVSKFVS